MLTLVIISEVTLIFLWQHGAKNLFFSPLQKVCTLEAKICPDGSTLGRSGSNCEFPTCPDIVTSPISNVNSEDIVLSVGQKIEITNLIVTLNSILEDSRCPSDVTCITAGSVMVEVTLRDSSGSGTVKLVTNDVPYQFDGNSISVTSVLPDRKAKKQISSDQYRVTFHISK